MPLTPRTLPVDLIWAVDTSGSMLEEAQAVQNTVNGVARAIIDAGLDVHMVMLANPPFCVGGDAGVCTPGICVPAPLGSGRCPEDSNPPRFFHHPTAVVISNDAALVLVNSFAGYRNVLRASSRKHLFVVTDDDSTGEDAGVYADDAARFIADYTALDPMFVDASGRGPTWRMSAMYAATECPNALRVGHVWKAIVDQTGGAHADICACAGTQPQSCTQAVQQWSSAVTSRIVADAQADCEWAIPAPPPGQTLDVDDVNVEFTASPGGARTILPRVTGAAACNAQGGWYFDNPVTPTTILACPASCAAVKAATQGEVTLHVRCRAR